VLERIYKRRVPRGVLVTPDLAHHLVDLSVAMNRQLGLLIARSGTITHVIVGERDRVFLPSLDDHPLGRKALRGLRLVHTHLRGETLSTDDLTDLSLLRLDMIAAIRTDDQDLDRVETAWIGPSGVEQAEVDLHHPPDDFEEFIGALEDEMQRTRGFEQSDARERAILVSVERRIRHEQEDSMAELAELAASSDVLVLGTLIQQARKINPRHLLGEGKLRELVIEAMNRGATMLIFDQALTPSQMRSIAEATELKVIDRSQLILDVFARRAHSHDGRVQVELAQLKYRLPHLSGKGTGMSRLMGGIGGRGPGETRLEVDRRRVRDRITLLERELKELGRARSQRKSRRVEHGAPIVSIVGYTNAGKSTLLNGLTGSDTFVEHRMFATLDTASRRLRFPREREVIITDTVGFIRDLPAPLMSAFAATLEELNDADLLVHLVDVSNPRYEAQMASVDAILSDLGLGEKPRVLAFNKADLVEPDLLAVEAARHGAVALSARDPKTCVPLLQAIEEALWHEKSEYIRV
jgi:GTP-binding protein HflX